MKTAISNVFSYLAGFLKDKNESSSKRLVGVMCSIFLCWTLYSNSHTAESIAPSAALVDAVALLAFGCLGLTSAEKIFKKKDTEANNPA